MIVSDPDRARRGLRRRDVLRRCAALAAAASIAAPRRLRAAPAARVLKLSYAIPRASHFGAGADEFCRRIEASTDGSWRIEQFPNGVLGGEVELVENLRKGQLDLGIVYTGALSGTVPELGVFDLPFLFADAIQACVTLDGPIGQEYLAKLRRHDLVGLAWGENGLRHITNSKRPIRTPEDIRGLRLRVPQSEVVARCFRQLGAEATPMSFTALYGALESGRFDGQENPIAVIRAGHLDRVQHHLTLSGHIYSSAIVLMSRDCWDELTAADRAIFVEAARGGGEASRHASREAERIGVDAMRAQGIEIVPSIDHAAFLAALQPTWSDIARQFGTDTVERLRNNS